MISKQILLFILLSIFIFPLAVMADYKAENKVDDSPASFILNLSDKIYKANSLSSNVEEKSLIIEDIIKKHVDIARIVNFVINKHVKNLEPLKQQEIKNDYAHYLIKKYSKLLTSYNGKLDIIRTQALNSNRFSVLTTIYNNTQKTNISYSLVRDEKSQFLIYDIIIADGISLSISDRDEVNGIIENRGLDYLIKQIKQK